MMTPKHKSARSTTVAAKIVMAVSGVVMALFLLAHMYGNLKAFQSAHAFNEYAHHLRVLGEPILPREGGLWIFRVVLLTAILAHIWSAVTLWKRADHARGGRYHAKKRGGKGYVANLMRWGGVTIALFVIFHILQFTTNTIRTNGYHAEPYDRMVAGFGTWWVVAVYLVTLLFIAMHLAHGVWSALQTLGVAAGRERLVRAIAGGFAALVVIGFAAVPLAVQFNILQVGAK